jgi:hypothetical protein
LHTTISRAHKYYFVLLDTLGYKDIRLEHPIVDGLFYCDIYLPEIDLVIDVHGPYHYANDPSIKAHTKMTVE